MKSNKILKNIPEDEGLMYGNSSNHVHIAKHGNLNKHPVEA